VSGRTRIGSAWLGVCFGFFVWGCSSSDKADGSPPTWWCGRSNYVPSVCECSYPGQALLNTTHTERCLGACCFVRALDGELSQCACVPEDGPPVEVYGGCEEYVAAQPDTVRVPYCPATAEQLAADPSEVECPEEPRWGCGTCKPCPAWANSCEDRECTLECATRYHLSSKSMADCNGDQEDGCETDLRYSTENCGECGEATESGSCSLGCKEGTANCDGEASNECETDLSGATNCGACGIECLDECLEASPSQQETGVLFACDAPLCPADRYDWNKDLADGCESEDICPTKPVEMWDRDGRPCTQVGARCYWEVEEYDEDDTCYACEGDTSPGVWRDVGVTMTNRSVVGLFVTRCLTPAKGCPDYATEQRCTEGDACCWSRGAELYRGECNSAGRWSLLQATDACEPQLSD
jgi:hypothetical protein